MAPSKSGSKCEKAKNPCKICLASVSPKTGVQCSGACRSWVHYECINYTPGKIRDIKEGLIKVTCPCPDCETQLPKEYRIEKPNCANHLCPANFDPRCDQDDCPSEQTSLHDNMNQTQWPYVECGAECKKHISGPEESDYKPWPVVKCGHECKKYTAETETLPRASQTPPRQQYQKHNHMKKTGIDGRDTEGTPSFSVVGQMCSTIGLLARQMNELMIKMQDIAQVTDAGAGGGGGGGSQGCHYAPAPCQMKENKKSPKNCYCPSNPR